MTQIPAGTKFIGLSEDVDLSQKRSALINSESEGYTIEDITETVNPTNAYKVYSILLEQHYTASPIATVMANTFSDTLTWTRTTVGTYKLTGTEIVVGRTLVFLGNSDDSSFLIFNAAVSSGFIELLVLNSQTGLLADGVLNNCPFELRVYNS